MLTPFDARTTIYGHIAELLAESGSAVPSLTGTENLYDLGLTSLLLARLILELEQDLGVDPFAADIAISDIRSVDDLVIAYARALVSVPAGHD